MALARRKPLLKRLRDRLRTNLAALEAFMADHTDIFGWRRPSGGSICFSAFRRPEGAAAFCERLVHEAGIMLLPSAPFQYGDRHVRIGFGRDNLPEVLQCFADFLARPVKASPGH